MQILIDNLSVEAINAALLRIQRSFKDNQASLTSNVNKIISNTSGVSSKYDDTALRNEISALQGILFQVQQSDENQNKRLDDHEEQIDQNVQNITVLQNLMSNIKFEYDIDTNTITFTNPSGDKVEVLLKDTTYSFGWDSETHALSIVDNFTGETIFNQVVDTFYSFSWANGVLTIADNRHDSPIAQISFDDRYYTESEIQTLILDLIPATASASNQLADKNWVNSSIETSTATFRGTYDSTSEISSVEGDNNDYLFVKTLNSSTGLYTYTKYTWVEDGGDFGHWKYAYDLNTSGFTSDQLAAINSGITSTIVENLLNGCYTGKTAHTLNTCDSWKSLLATKCGASATYCDSSDYFNTNILANFCYGYLKANRYCFNDRVGFTNRSICGVYSAANLGVATTCEMGICEFFYRAALCNKLRSGEKLTINYGWSNSASMRLNYPDGTSNCVSGWVVQFWPDTYGTDLWDNTKCGWFNIFAEINTLTSKRLFRIYKGSNAATCATVTEIKYECAANATNSTCFGGYTYSEACTDIRDGLLVPSDLDGYATETWVENKKYCTHDCLVKLSLLCSDIDRSVLFSAQENGCVCPVYASNGVPFTYNACCGQLKIGDFSCECCNNTTLSCNGLFRNGPKGSQTNAFFVQKEADCLNNCSLGVGIGSGNINRGFFDYCKASETATSPTFRWLQYWDSEKEIHNLPIWGELGSNNKVVYSCIATTPSNTRRYALICFDKTCCGNPSNTSACFEIDIYTSKYYIWIDVANSAACMRTYWVNNGLDPNKDKYGSFCAALPDTTQNGNCFWITYSNYRAPVIKSARKISIICNTTTAPSGITFSAPTNRNSYIDLYCGTTCIGTLQGPSSLCLGCNAFSNEAFTTMEAVDACGYTTCIGDVVQADIADFITMEDVEACGYLKNCLATNIKVNGSNKTTILDTIGTLDNTYPKKTYQVSCSTAHCRYIYLGKLPVSSGAVSYASLTMYLFSFNCQITQQYPIGTIQIDVSSGASNTAFNIRGWSDIPLNSATCSSTSPRLYVTKDTTCGYYCLYLDDSYNYLKPKVQINQSTNFTVGDLSASSEMSGTSYWNSVSCNDIVYLNKINKWCVDTNGNTCCVGFICGSSGSLMNFLFYKAANTVSSSSGDPVYRLIYDITAWWNCAGSSSSNTSARGIVGSICAYRNSGYGTSAIVDIEAWTNYGRGNTTNPLNSSVLKLVYFNKGTDIVQPLILKNTTSDGDKYYLAIKQLSYANIPLIFSGISYSGAWLTCQICATNSSGALPACWEVAISGIKCSSASLELYTTTPYIDFHAGNIACDYTHRIIACPGTSTTTYGSLQFLTNNVSYNPNNGVYTCTQGCNFYMYPGGMFQSMKGAYFGSTSADTCSLVTIDCNSQYSIKINKGSGADKGILLTTANNCLDYCSLGIEIGSGNVNRGFFDYYKASETATSPTFRWLLHANADTWTSSLQNFQIGSGSATESAGVIYGKGTCATNAVIRFLNNTSASDGNGYLIYAGGIGILGAGEGASYVWCSINGSTNLYGACVGKECLYLTSDNNIYFYTCTQCNDSSCWKISCIDSNGIYYGTAAVGRSYLRTPVLMSMGIAGTPSTSDCVKIRACCTDCNCTVTTRDWTFCGCDGLLYSNGFRTNCNGVSISYPKASTTYVLLGCIKQTQLDNEYQIGFYVSGSNVVNNGVLKWIGSNSGVQGQNNIEIKLSNYCNGAYGITGIGFIKTASAWNCWTCVVLRICNQHTSCAYCWNTGVYKNQIGVCGGWVESLTCLGSTAPTFDCFVDIPTECRNFTYRNGCVCIDGDFNAPLIHTKCIYSAYPAKNTSQSITFYARCCDASAITSATMTFNPTGVLCVCRINNNGYNQKWQQTINLSSQSTNCFYPVTWPSGVTYENDIEIQSPSGSGSMAYNQNYIHFYERAGGWSDMPKTVYVQTLSRFDNGENVFGCIGYGSNSAYYSVIWLRGGMNYTVNANVALTAHTSNVTCGDTSNSPSTFTVGTSLCGGTNTCVGIFANATTNTGTFSNQNTYGAFYNRDGCAYILKCDVDNCGFIGHDCLVKYAAVTSNFDRNILMMACDGAANSICPVYFNNVSGKAFTYNAACGLLKIGPIVGCTSSQAGSSGTNVGLGYIELSGSTPFIDFHRNNACQDFSSRIIDGGTNGLCITVNNATGCTASNTSCTFCFLPTGVFKSPYDICSPYIRASTALEALNFYNMTQAHETQPACAACCPNITFVLRCRYNSGTSASPTWSLSEKCVIMCGADGGLYATHKGCSCLNWHGIVTCQCSYSLTANTIYYIKVGRLLDGFMTGTTELDIMASGSSLVDKVNIKWLGGCANAAGTVNGIEINATNYAPLKGLLGIGWVRTGSNWNCANDIYIKVCAPATSTYCFGLNRTLLGCAGSAWTTGFSCTTTAPAFTCFVCTKPNGARAFHWLNGDTYIESMQDWKLIGSFTGTRSCNCYYMRLGSFHNVNPETCIKVVLRDASHCSSVYISTKGTCLDCGNWTYQIENEGNDFILADTLQLQCNSTDTNAYLGIIDSCCTGTICMDIYQKGNDLGFNPLASTTSRYTNTLSGYSPISIVGKNLFGYTNFSNINANRVDSYVFTTTSALKCKCDITKPSRRALDIIDSLDIVEYRYKNEDKSEPKHIGIIADYTDELLSGKTHDQLRLADAVGLLLQAVKELKEEKK